MNTTDSSKVSDANAGANNVIHIPHNDWKGFQSGHLCGELAAVAGNNFIPITVRARPCDERSQHSKLGNTFHCPGHSFIIHNFERMHIVLTEF